MKIFDALYLDDLTNQAKRNPRQRQHKNIHDSYQDASQRLFNAIELGSYIRPHKHATDPKDELLVAVRGLMALVLFDDDGAVLDVVRFGTEKYGPNVSVGTEVCPRTWHTVFALVPGCVLLEVKAGPFDPNQPKDLAPWAPEEGTAVALEYFNKLIDLAR
jgi:cupin fold WbuC family metalloprotein